MGSISISNSVPTDRAQEVEDIISSLQTLIKPFIQAADKSVTSGNHARLSEGESPPRTLLEHHPPAELSQLLKLDLPELGLGKDGLLQAVEKTLKYSVNTWDRGFMDKLYPGGNAVSVASELLLAVLNTNVHVYAVSPVLTLIEKHVTNSLATLIGYHTPHAGGISQPGGSASNSTSIIIARNTLFPFTKTDGYRGHRFVLFTSAHGHYSLEKAAQMFGFGSSAVRGVPIDQMGRMRPDALSQMIKEARDAGETPFYVNATAGTTVLGSFDPIAEIADVCERERLWLHVDGSWGGGVAFSDVLRKGRLEGVERADSMAITPHKMLGVGTTCSFLCGKDIRTFHKAMTLPAGYLFHNQDPDEEIFDLADLTPQCGRKGDALKLFMGWTFHGRAGYAQIIEEAFATAEYMYSLLAARPNFVLVSKPPLPCLQVCFYWTPGGNLDENKERNGIVTAKIAQGLVGRGWMIDYAPGERGSFLRVVVNRDTRRVTAEGLVAAIEEVGKEVVAENQ